MPTWVVFGLEACLALALLLALVDFGYFRSGSRFLISVLALVAFVIVLRITTEFPSSSSRQSFGGASPLLALALMFFGVILGMAATYIFNLAASFSWRDFTRPLVVSPLVLLPLIGSLQGAALEPIQLICFTVLAFQNGFFWQQVLRDAKPTT
jgi:hypothetical protein